MQAATASPIVFVPAPGASAPAVSARGLARRYGRRWALAGVSLEIPRGTVAMVTGPNGAGKSTLLRVLATALGPHAGTATVAGFDVVTQTEEVRRRIALLDHRLHHYAPLSARENLRLAAADVGRDDLESALGEVGLEARAGDAVSTYSAGMRKRLALARVLLQRPQVALLDEPYGELDPAGFRLVDGLLERFRRQGSTVVLSTHLVARGRENCDLAVALADGRLAWSGPARALPAVEGL